MIFAMAVALANRFARTHEELDRKNVELQKLDPDNSIRIETGKLESLKFTTVCQTSQAIYPRLKPGGSTVAWIVGGVVSTGPASGAIVRR